MLIDTHAHLYDTQFEEDREQVVANCLSHGVNKVLLPNIDRHTIDPMLDLVKAYPSIFYPMMGVHPGHIKPDNWKEELKLTHKILYKNPKDFIAVGEIGIDLYWDKTTLSIQQEAFKIQISWAQELALPIVIHARDSFEEIFEVLDTISDANLKGVFHCFTGNKEQAQRVIDYGFLLGIGGIATFKNGGLDNVLPHFDVSNFILETDAPYLAPVPHRGKRNESAYLSLIAEKMGDLFSCSASKIAEITSCNAINLFKLDGP